MSLQTYLKSFKYLIVIKGRRNYDDDYDLIEEAWCEDHIISFLFDNLDRWWTGEGTLLIYKNGSCLIRYDNNGYDKPDLSDRSPEKVLETILNLLKIIRVQ